MIGSGIEPDLTVLAPVHNEAGNLGPLIEEIRAVLDESGLRFEILLVDDGSTDGSGELIRGLERRTPGLRGLHLGAHRGQTAALAAGFAAARGDRVVTLDADLQNDPADIPALLAALDEADAAVGYRIDRQDDWLRRVSSRVANAVRNRLTGEEIIDSGCGLKAFRRECLAGLRLSSGLHRFLPTLVRMEGYRVVQLPVRHRPRRWGRNKYGVGNRVFRACADLMRVRRMQRRGPRPR
jgi:glycosyltransferase involved in cell wall biosynthesis